MIRELGVHPAELYQEEVDLRCPVKVFGLGPCLVQAELAPRVKDVHCPCGPTKVFFAAVATVAAMAVLAMLARSPCRLQRHSLRLGFRDFQDHLRLRLHRQGYQGPRARLLLRSCLQGFQDPQGPLRRQTQLQTRRRSDHLPRLQALRPPARHGSAGIHRWHASSLLLSRH